MAKSIEEGLFPVSRWYMSERKTTGGEKSPDFSMRFSIHEIHEIWDRRKYKFAFPHKFADICNQERYWFPNDTQGRDF